MALTGVSWPSLDLHVVRGVPSMPLLARLLLFDDATPGSDPTPTGDHPPANIAVQLRPGFQPDGPQAPGSVSGHGVSVDTRTGVVTVEAAPAGGRRLRNFLLTVTASDNDTHRSFTRQIRVQVHDAVAAHWLTPATLTLRPVPNEFRPSTLSFLAQFDDGVIGDVGNWQLQWSTDPPSAVLPDESDIQIVNAEEGEFVARRTGAHARLNVAYPPLGLSAHAEITCVEAWGTDRELTWIGGKDPAKWRDVPNVLFLGEGFAETETERSFFLTLVRNVVRKLRTPTLRPYDVLYDSMNYWAAFLGSTEPGFSIRGEVYTETDPGGLISTAMPVAQAPAPAAARWSVAELLHQVGLPVKVDATRALDGSGGLLEVWQRVYGPEVTRARVENSWEAWRLLASRVLVNDRDTAFGITLAGRPSVEGAADDFNISWDRVRPASVDELLTHLRYRGEAVGETWRPATPSGETPKDHRLVCFLVRSRMGRAANKGEFFVSTLAKVSGHYVRPAPGGGIEIVPVRLKRKADPMPASEKGQPHVDVDDPPIEGVAVVAHETGHSLGLGDEYADNDPEHRNLPGAASMDSYGNIQEASSTLGPGQKLQSSRIKWGSWHRILAAGVLAQDPDPTGIAQDYRLTLEPGHAGAFRENDLVRLRRRPLFPDTLVSDVMRVKKTPAANEAHLDVTVLFSGWTSPGFFKAGSILMKMLRWPFENLGLNLGEELLLVAGIIREHIDRTQLPLNARPGRALAACEPDSDGRQSARNLPDGLPKCQPRNRSRIVGLYEGGWQYHCGVYHPTGACVMRTENMDEHIPFCPVCRYIMVDMVDPTKHGVIDGEYAKIYPDPRT